MTKRVPPRPELFDDPGLRAAPYARPLTIDPYPEAIIAAAVLRDGKVWTGRRHCFIISKVYQDTGSMQSVRLEEQGFLTDTGLFVTRAQAVGIAYASGQLPEGFKGGELTSEDLW